MPAPKREMLVPATPDKLAIYERHAWYIEASLRIHLSQLRKNVEECKEAMKDDDGSFIYRSLQGLIDHTEEHVRDFQKAYDDLSKNGCFPRGY